MRSLFSLMLVLTIFVTGCVRYDVAIDFQDQHSGKIVQNIQLAPQLNRLSSREVEQWIGSLKERAISLSGNLERLSAEDLRLSIPFGNSQDLVSKFNRLFPQSTVKNNQIDNESELVNLNAIMSISQQNLLLLEKNLIDISVDLRGLGIVSQEGNIIASSGSLLDLSLSLNSPLPIRVLKQNSKSSQDGNHLIWHLQPGQVNHIEVLCWVPSYLCIGGLLIILLFFVGYYLKYKKIPGLFLHS